MTKTLMFMALLALAPAAYAADKAGDVVYLKGSAVVERQEKKIKAVLRAPLQETDNVQTRELSRLKILFRNDSILTLGSNTKLVIKQYLYNPQSKRAESLYELADGKLKSVVGGGPFKVTTPTAFAAARGTVFFIWYDSAANTTWLAVTEGGAEFGNSNPNVPGKRIITAGHMSSISGNEPPTPPKPISFGPDEGPSGPGSVLAEFNELNLPPPIRLAATDLLPLRDLRGRLTRLSGAPPIDQIPAHATVLNFSLVFQ
jgi:hypothetical protein